MMWMGFRFVSEVQQLLKCLAKDLNVWRIKNIQMVARNLLHSKFTQRVFSPT